VIGHGQTRPLLPPRLLGTPVVILREKTAGLHRRLHAQTAVVILREKTAGLDRAPDFEAGNLGRFVGFHDVVPSFILLLTARRHSAIGRLVFVTLIANRWDVYR
jgi:hypothetical protein